LPSVDATDPEPFSITAAPVGTTGDTSSTTYAPTSQTGASFDLPSGEYTVTVINPYLNDPGCQTASQVTINCGKPQVDTPAPRCRVVTPKLADDQLHRPQQLQQQSFESSTGFHDGSNVNLMHGDRDMLSFCHRTDGLSLPLISAVTAAIMAPTPAPTNAPSPGPAAVVTPAPTEGACDVDRSSR